MPKRIFETDPGLRAEAEALRQQHHTKPEPNGHDTGEGPLTIDLPIIEVRGGERHKAADEGLSALYAARTPFFQRDRELVRVCMIQAKAADGELTFTPGIVQVTHAALGRELGRSARWIAFDRKGKERRIDPPKPVVEQITAMVGEWSFPSLAGVTGTPTMRPDGSLLLNEGYDDATGLVLLGAPKMPPIPKEPTQSDAVRALALIDGLLEEFPFADADKGDQSVNRSVALSMLLTPVLRGALAPAVPMHLVRAPESGSGKSYLADLVSMIATGDRCAVMARAQKPDEIEKRLVGAALDGYPIIAIDNYTGIIEGEFLCQLTERPRLQLRSLGTSVLVRVSNTFTVLANGNNVTIAGDMVRRTIQSVLDANMEKPEEREFQSDPVALVKADRGLYIAACLTIARAYICAGKPNRARRLPSYGGWSDLVRSPLIWLGRPDPVLTMNTARSADPVRQARTTVFTAWADELGIVGGFRTSELIDRANDRDLLGHPAKPLLRAAFLEVAAAQTREPQIDATRLGNWLRGAKDTVAGGYKLTVDDSDKKRPRWVLRRA